MFFPQGNWEFNSTTERMVQLYPTPFWELIATTLAILVLALCALVWLVATLRARSLDQGAAIAAAAPAGPAGAPAPNGPSAAGRAGGGGR